MFATSFVLGYHGCDREVGEKILRGETHVSVSSNPYDWLGSGAYFWQGSPDRAQSWAEFLRRFPPRPEQKIKKPFVIGAVIDLGNCLDLTDAGSLEIALTAYEALARTMKSAGSRMPANEPSHGKDADLVKRHLDCAVVNFVHSLREEEGEPPFHSVRGIFTEGGELYPGARIMAKTHVQVCVRNPATSIKGYFLPQPRLSYGSAK